MSSYPKNWNDIRKRIIKRDGAKCYYCGETERLDVHHLRPISMGGNNDDYNLLTLCHECHVVEHQGIRASGLCCIPGPDHEEYRAYLTNYTDVVRFCDTIEKSTGRDMSYLRNLNEGVGS